jgi:hypothetical protein
MIVLLTVCAGFTVLLCRILREEYRIYDAALDRALMPVSTASRVFAAKPIR